MKNIRIYLHHREENIKTLGPGDRYAIWVQGCTHNCKGCIAPESHSLDSNGYWIEVSKILKEIRSNKKLRGITISGGEPFLQAKSLLSLLKELQKEKLDVICYTGFQYEDILNDKIPFGKKMLDYIDILIDGKYVEELNNESYLRGSDNQRIIHLKNTYKVYEGKMNELKNRNVEIKIIDNKTLFIAGIPPKKMEKDWKKIREKIYE
ncbi:4Fe-4S single cluster domain-containing protein [Fusobacterium mortiferum]|uniref:Radical SAM protein n=1 Tax=Fusobacterium mortiferum TaxID=850 RepID=A0ABS2G4U7_FUSMR|nr:4Fe-4S single cluster domain-containing protein [Fusobacterium mortiferum]MBM6875912.1 radical SAM protein [Fusobacterium mortiferum]